ncbi:LacI family DNA-binding transcriptional regulator [Streptomyces albidoflavus]|uniref:LacI family DNA-binding transcriptional regulator n=1 Tax=Streptomyces albidoflavus TaxID=1886 RepID=UPI001E4D6922|nr:LacI family DNA-binding transcriptional regulator [Streptomyces albidoflavus]
MAAAAGVSTATVSQAVNDTGRISEATRRRVLAAADELGWSRVPGDRAAQGQDPDDRARGAPSDGRSGRRPPLQRTHHRPGGPTGSRGYGLLLHLVPTWPRRAHCTNGSSPKAASTVPS